MKACGPVLGTQYGKSLRTDLVPADRLRRGSPSAQSFKSVIVLAYPRAFCGNLYEKCWSITCCPVIVQLLRFQRKRKMPAVVRLLATPGAASKKNSDNHEAIPEDALAR